MVLISNFLKPIDNPTISTPILHNIIKAYLVYDAEHILNLCSTLPQTKSSRIFLQTSPHKFVDAREEWFVDGIKYPADAVWRFATYYNDQTQFPSYYIIHEIKTGKYNIIEEMHKHYIHNNHVQLYIWAYPRYHNYNEKPPGTFVKLLNINSLKPHIITNVRYILDLWGGE